MSIQPRLKPAGSAVQAASDTAADAFIAGAPDARLAVAHNAPKPSYEKGIAKGHKRQISHTIDPELLREVDELAKRTGQARAAVINMCIYRGIKGEIFES